MNRIAPPGAKNIGTRRAAQVLQMIDPAISRSGHRCRFEFQVRLPKLIKCIIDADRSDGKAMPTFIPVVTWIQK